MKQELKKQKDILSWLIPFVANYQNLGEKYIVSAKVHMDESTPHLHILFVPVIHKFDTKSGKTIAKIACSEYQKGKDSYKKLQDSFYKFITDSGFDLERGKSTGVEHLSTEKYKQITEFNNIKSELQAEPIKQLETQDLSLILMQNKQLIQYNKKLKNYLLKSYKAIDASSLLQQENADLRHENQKLQEKNAKLTNYIEKTFEVVKHLFNFPKDRLKRLVDNFIKGIDK